MSLSRPSSGASGDLSALTTAAKTSLVDAVNEVDAQVNAHENGGASKHDATEVDYERADGSKKSIAAASDTVESAITNLDDAIGAVSGLVTGDTVVVDAVNTLAGRMGSLDDLDTTEDDTLVGAINEVSNYAIVTLNGRVDDLEEVNVVAVVTVPSVSGTNNAALTLQLYRLDGVTAISSARQVMIISGANQYEPFQALGSGVTFITATTGSLIATGTGWALVETSATGAFACTAVNSADNAQFFKVLKADAVSDVAKGCTVVASNSDQAVWSA